MEDSKKKRKREDTPNKDEDEDHFDFEHGMSITPRYKVYRLLGDGTFGRALEVWDRKREKFCALKIVRRVKRYTDAARIEAEVLTAIRHHDDRDNSSGCVQLINYFEWHGHFCLVFEKLGMSLYDFIKKNDYQGFPMKVIQDIGKQILSAVSFLHRISLTHTDLKPENVLFVDSEYDYRTRPPHVRYKSGRDVYRVPLSTAVKLIDFGGATFERDHHSSIINTRQYRAPEVMLGMRWSHPSDIWSVGCILMELYTGELLFPTHENFEHLALMEACLGPLPKRMISGASKACAKYFANDRLNWPEGASSKESLRAVGKMLTLEDMVRPEHIELARLVKYLLTFDPNERPTAQEALAHPFFRISYPADY
eukprot:GILJ01011318.1.p1 GENE.GILJ01011318.1~~GILJ01011318.1.p1  ORF type:complete len:375 (+),score=32.29 GILJ01011318.1:26-1126(+)